MADLGRELEACLEELRAHGGAQTMVMPAAPARTSAPAAPAARPPERRTPLAALLVVGGLAAAVAVLAVVLVHENGDSPSGSPTANGSGTPIALSGVGAYDPPPGDGQEHDSEAPTRPTRAGRRTGRRSTTVRRSLRSASAASGSCSTPGARWPCTT
jgi:hypothetical protein